MLSAVAEQARGISPPRVAGGIGGFARSRSRPGRSARPVGDAAHAERARLPRRRARSRPRPRCGAQADRRGRRAGRTSRTGRGLARAARCRARPAHGGAAAAATNGAARWAWRLCRRSGEPRRCHAHAGRARAAAGAPDGLGGFIPLERLLVAAARHSGDAQPDRAGKRPGLGLSHPSRVARALSAAAADHTAGPLYPLRRPGAGLPGSNIWPMCSAGWRARRPVLDDAAAVHRARR